MVRRDRLGGVSAGRVDGATEVFLTLPLSDSVRQICSSPSNSGIAPTVFPKLSICKRNWRVGKESRKTVGNMGGDITGCQKLTQR